MKTYENQQEEIKTIQKRTFQLNLSDADVERIYKLTGQHGITPETLLESFIGDVVDGTYSNGSDERERADSYFERCWWSTEEDTTTSLLRYLLNNSCNGYSVDDFVVDWEEKKYFEDNPNDEDVKKEVEELEPGKSLWFVEELTEMFEGLDLENYDMEKEYHQCKDWVERRDAMLNPLPTD